MSRRLNRVWPLLVMFFAGEVLALGLGDIRLNSALNEPLRAEIELLSPTPEDFESLKITLASASTFERYGIDRPLFLTRLTFNIVRTGGGNAVIRVTSQQPIAEPFVTFLVEANWAQGRLLREYTVLLDPPTFAPPPASPSTEAVAAPARATQADRGRIERPAAPAQPAQPSRAAPGTFDTAAGDDYQVQRGDTLWRIAEQVRPDNRLSMNQMMVAIYQSNPEAFAGNVNVLRADARLTIPSADDIFRISRGDALSEVQRQNAAWSGGAASPAAGQPSLTLVPPDGDQEDYRGAGAPTDGGAGDAASRDRIRQLERQVEQQESLLEVRDNELAQLRDELARLREAREAQAAAEAPADAAVADTESPAVADDDAIFVEDEPAVEGDETAAEAPVAAEPAAAEPSQPAPRVVRTPAEPGLVDRIVGALTGIWGLIGLALLIVMIVLVWFARRASGSDDGDSTGVWDALDADDIDSESVASTERLRALARDDDESIVVVEGGEASGRSGDTLETPRIGGTGAALRETGAPVSLEDTFSSETAINLDQSDPVAEADFHMAYGLYDQAADLINGALAVEPERKDLMAKLCEIYFVWGNRDAFVESAGRLKDSLGDDSSGDWDKIVIMGQQIAGDHELFSHAKAGSAGQSVDLAFDESGDSGVLDMDFDSAGPDGSVSDIVDVGSDEDDGSKDMTGIFGGANDDDGLDFTFDEDQGTGETITREMPRADRRDDDDTVESPAFDNDATAESPALGADDDSDTTMESPTIQQRPTYDPDNTSELPALSDDDETTTFGARGDRSDQTAEIDLDDLGLDLDSLGGDVADGDTGIMSALDDTGTRRAWDDDSTAETGRNERLDADDADSDTQRNKAVDDDLMNATGETQVLPEDFAVETGRNPRVDIADDEATMLAKGLDSGDDPDFDYAATEALPKDTFERDSDETGERPGPTGSTDLDLDLDDLTAALKMSESGDTVNQSRDDETVEQPRMKSGGDDDLDFDLGMDSGSEEATQSLSPDDLSDDLHDARTMTEVGTKLDLARAYVDMGDPGGARNILEEVLEEGDASQRQQAQQLLDTLPG